MYIVNDFPIGRLKIECEDDSIIKIIETDEPVKNSDVKVLNVAARELREYFFEKRNVFTFPIKLTGTPFQVKVYEALLNVNYGETVSYQTLAQHFESKNYARAVANAVGKNPLLIVVPCHRVLRSDGTIGGFRLGNSTKRYLLTIENIICNNTSNDL